MAEEMGVKKDFIKFLNDALPHNGALMNEALSQNSPQDLYNFFQDKRYTDVPFEDCPGLISARQKAHGKGVNRVGLAVDVDDDGERPFTVRLVEKRRDGPAIECLVANQFGCDERVALEAADLAECPAGQLVGGNIECKDVAGRLGRVEDETESATV